MALILNDRVKETSTSAGTGDITLAGAVNGFESFQAGIISPNTTYYTISEQGTNDWEVGIGTLSAATTLERTTVLTSSNSDALVNFNTSGTSTLNVFCTLPASKAIYLDAAGSPVGAAGTGFAVAMAIAL
jgi:hypothetical protein|tara:strand:+ start:180 stop:569 length:390 start_codon:yes stop_codon:yes gene_type:complete